MLGFLDGEGETCLLRRGWQNAIKEMKPKAKKMGENDYGFQKGGGGVGEIVESRSLASEIRGYSFIVDPDRNCFVRLFVESSRVVSNQVKKRLSSPSPREHTCIL